MANPFDYIGIDDSNRLRGDSVNQNNDSSQNGIYRAAFPAFRVFIFGKEVSDDVVDIRVNQSGGSMDRSTATVSISLANLNDRYILNHIDMLAANAGRVDFVESLARNINNYRDLIPREGDSVGERSNSVDRFMRNLEEDARYADLKPVIQEAYSAIYSEGDQYAGKFDLHAAEPYTTAGARHYRIKYNVLQGKALETINGSSAILEAIRKNDPANLYQFTEEELQQLYKYPLAEGDCIFHPNDPLRVAFRDPFEPWKWYWMFTGFVDGYSEEVGVNLESTVTISGTDVLKTARYSYFQLDADAVRDVGIRALFAQNPNLLQDPNAVDVAEINWRPTENIFAGFSIEEVLEILFFGLDSFQSSVDKYTLELLGNMTEEETFLYLLNSTQGAETPESVKAMTLLTRVDKIRGYAEERKTQFGKSVLPPLVNSSGVGFKRSGEIYGVHAVYIGDSPSPAEYATGTVFTTSQLHELNNLLYHRVSSEDLFTMKHEERQTLVNRAKSVGDIYESSTVFNTITTIGTDIETYPVGHGRVFMVLPSKLSMGLAGKALNEDIRSASSDLHSEYKDRLTYLFDIADTLQFCFYATPRGDVVFEMPFYDFQPWSFSQKTNFVWNENIAAKTEQVINEMSRNVEKWASGSTKYSPDDVYKMMGLYNDLELAANGMLYRPQGVKLNNYGREFTFDRSDTIGYSNTLNDTGIKTIARCNHRILSQFSIGKNDSAVNSVYATAPGLSAILGFRMAADVTPWISVTSPESAQLTAAVELRKANADARNLGLQVLPRFGLMVNRPTYWRPRNYLANIVSCQHSISVNSACQTTINLSHVKAWSGRYEKGTKRELWEFFGGSSPFDYQRLLELEKNANAEKVGYQDRQTYNVEKSASEERAKLVFELEKTFGVTNLLASELVDLTAEEREVLVAAFKTAEAEGGSGKAAAEEETRKQKESTKEWEELLDRPLTKDEKKELKRREAERKKKYGNTSVRALTNTKKNNIPNKFKVTSDEFFKE